MLSLLIAAVLKFSPTIARALASPVGGMLAHVIGRKFGAGYGKPIEELADMVSNHPEAAKFLGEIENEHGDILKTYSTGSQPPMMEMTIVQKYYYGESQHGRQEQATGDT